MRTFLVAFILGYFFVANTAAGEPEDRAETARQLRILLVTQGPYFRTHCGCGNIDSADYRALQEVQQPLSTVTDLAAPEVERQLFDGREFRRHLFLVVLDSGMSDATKLAFARRAALLEEAKLPERAVYTVAHTLNILGSRQDLPRLADMARRYPDFAVDLALEACVRLGCDSCDLLLFDELAELDRFRLESAGPQARESLARRVREVADSEAPPPSSNAN